MLYVHPGVAGQGVGSMLLDALEELAGGRGPTNSRSMSATTPRISSASAAMSPAAQQHPLNGEWLANTTMQKTLDGGGQS